ncbi:NADPH oxidase [Grosmannia clavigera kw1407]|uniref:NADPH oxidase n=1 Tax=Grosmannia clavigera (strain kw1407 / UAMH 11150) TaxID=655863 RepID=F0XLG7_GROCL|nr:NADPH oxidase [Grosmannia clavigera kw1407]EFX01095.1 NADPH oxidase [Grosmannia clavigera kw1407]
MFFSFGFVNYSRKDNLAVARSTFGPTYMIARSAALVLHFDVALVLFPVCRTFISLARQTPLNGIIQFDKNITFHITTAWSIVFFSWVHTIAHWNNFAQIAAKNNLGIYGWLLANFVSGPGWTGYVMLIALMGMVLTSVEKPRRANYERFWYTHHMFVVFFFFWAIHGAFCMIQPDFAPFCISIGTQAVGVFWQFWMYGGFVYLAERVAREMRGRHNTYISKVVQHPSNVCEIQIKKENTKTRAGQYIFLCCPAVSIWQYHPFTLTSAPEEDYISVHIRVAGDFTTALAKAVGCDFGKDKDASKVVGVSGGDGSDVDPALRRILPRVYVDGPFGSASEDVFKYEIAMLVGAGIGVTPFASILKSIWYRMNYPQTKTRLSKVYFFWICRDFGSFEWFRSLLLAIEAQDVDNRIEIHTYLTAKIKIDDATNIMINDANADKDAITGLRAPTNFGRPNWDMIFRGIRKLHTPAEAGVFFCGPKGLGSTLHIFCNKYSEPGPSSILVWYPIVPMSADFWAGYISGAAGILIGNPLDIVKVRLQAGTYSTSSSLSSLSSLPVSLSSSPSSSSSFSSSAILRRTVALATGAAAPILGYGALNALLFVSYRQAEEVLQPGSSAGLQDGSPSSLTTTWLAGAVAGLATWVVSTPTELIKCQAQTAPTRTASSPPSSWAIARQVWTTSGLRGFFLGGSVTALRDSIGYGFYFWSYQLATDAWRQRWPADDGSTNTSTNSQTAALVCGGLAGIVTWASVFPLDVVKTRVQAQVQTQTAALTSASSPLLATSSPPRLSTLQITRLAYREGGLAVFFRGLGVCSARAFVVNAVQWAVYEWIMRELGATPGLREEGVAM